MRILVLHSELGVLRGGGENFTRNLFAAFHKRGHDVRAAFVTDRGCRYPFAMPLGIEPVPIRGWWTSELGQSTLSSLGSLIARVRWLKPKWDHFQNALHWRTHRWHTGRFRKRVEQDFAKQWGQFDVIYVHHDCRLAATVAQYRPTVLRLAGPLSPSLAPLLKKVHVVCANGDALIQTKKILGDAAIELPVGVDTTMFSPGQTAIRQSLGWSEKHFVIGYVGRLLRLKGIDLLAAAFREIVKTVPQARLLIVGSGEKLSLIQIVLREEIRRGLVHLESDVSHQRLAEWYRAMDLFVMPSRYENFSNAILEALACGVPFLASDIGGNRILAKAVGGSLFLESSVHALAMSIQQVIENSRELPAHGLIRAEYVRQNYDWAVSAECLERMIRSRLVNR